jgi:hypothetical protein
MPDIDPNAPDSQQSDVAPPSTGSLGLTPDVRSVPTMPDPAVPVLKEGAMRRLGRFIATIAPDALVGAAAGSQQGTFVGGAGAGFTASRNRVSDQQLQAAKIKFANAQAAQSVAHAAATQFELEHMPEELQMRHEAQSARTAELLQQAGLPLLGVSDHTSDSAMATLNNLAADNPNGVVPHTINVTLPSSGKTLTFGTDKIVADPTKFNQVRALAGYPPLSTEEFNTTKPEKRQQLLDNAIGMWTDAPDDKNVDSFIARVQNARNMYDRATPNWRTDKAETLKRFDERIADLKDNQKFFDKRFQQRESVKQAIHDQAHETLRNSPSLLGDTTDLDAKEYNMRARSFKSNADQLRKLEESYDMFRDAAADARAALNGGPDITGAKSVTALFNAIGLSAAPLKGAGFRINNNTVEEHATARSLGEGVYQKLLRLRAGDVITPQQILDYTSVAEGARRSSYRSTINEARGQGLKADFLLPRGNGRSLDPNTQQIFMDAANGDAAKASSAAKQFGWRF